jgi:hypothetical protein
VIHAAVIMMASNGAASGQRIAVMFRPYIYNCIFQCIDAFSKALFNFDGADVYGQTGQNSSLVVGAGPDPAPVHWFQIESSAARRRRALGWSGLRRWAMS